MKEKYYPKKKKVFDTSTKKIPVSAKLYESRQIKGNKSKHVMDTRTMIRR